MTYIGQRIDDYSLVQRLETGAFTEVYLGQHIFSTPIRFAVKTLLQPTPMKQNLLQKRFSILSQLDYPAIIKYSPLNSAEPAFLLDLAARALPDQIADQTLHTLTFFMQTAQQIAEALHYAPSKGFVHGNLKRCFQSLPEPSPETHGNAFPISRPSQAPLNRPMPRPGSASISPSDAPC